MADDSVGLLRILNEIEDEGQRYRIFTGNFERMSRHDVGQARLYMLREIGKGDLALRIAAQSDDVEEMHWSSRSIPPIVKYNNGHPPVEFDEEVIKIYQSLTPDQLVAMGKTTVDNILSGNDFGDIQNRDLANAIDILVLSGNQEAVRESVEKVLNMKPDPYDDGSSCSRNPAMGALRGATYIGDRDLMFTAAVKGSETEWMPSMFSYAEYVLERFDRERSAMVEIAQKLETRGGAKRTTQNIQGALAFYLASGDSAEFHNFVSRYVEQEPWVLYHHLRTYIAEREVGFAVKNAYRDTVREVLRNWRTVKEKHSNWDTALPDSAIATLHELGDTSGLSKIMDAYLEEQHPDYESAKKIGDVIGITEDTREKVRQSANGMIAEGKLIYGLRAYDIFEIEASAPEEVVRAGLTKALESESKYEIIRGFEHLHQMNLLTPIDFSRFSEEVGKLRDFGLMYYREQVPVK